MSGHAEKMEGIADTVDEAFAKAQSKLPDNVEVLGKNVIFSPRTATIIVDAVDESTATKEARSQMWSEYSPKSTRLNGVKFNKAGKKGFFGIGKKPGQYEAEIIQQAIVEIVFKEIERVFPSEMDYATAIAYCKEAAELRKTSSRKSLTQVESIYRAVINARPDLWIGHFGLGEVLSTSARMDRKGSRAALEQAVQLAPNERSPLFELTQAVTSSEAIEYYKKALTLKPSGEEEWLYPRNLQSFVHWEMGSILADKGYSEEAVNAFYEAILVKPTYYTQEIHPSSELAQVCWHRAIQAYNSY